MELFILKLAGTICATILAITIVITRKDDIGISAIIIAIILEIVALCIIYIDFEQVILLINTIRTK